MKIKKHININGQQDSRQPVFHKKNPFISIWSRRLLLATSLAVATLSYPKLADAQVQIAGVSSKFPIPEFETEGEKYIVIINGDPSEARHKGNVTKALNILNSRGFKKENAYIAGKFEGEENEVHSYNAVKADIKKMFTDLSEIIQPEDKVVVYVTGHGDKNFISLESGKLPHSDFIKMIEPFKQNDNVYIFDHCYSGALPDLIIDGGFIGTALAPVVKDKTCFCHLFSPYFWDMVGTGMDINGDKQSNISEIFNSAIDIYSKNLGEPTTGTFRKSIPELSSIDELADGLVLVELEAEWCSACKAMKPLINLLQVPADALRVFTLDMTDVEVENPIKKGIEEKYKDDLQNGIGPSLPTLLFFKNGKFAGMQIGSRTLDELKQDYEKFFGESFAAAEVKIVEHLENSLESGKEIDSAGATALATYYANNGDFKKVKELLKHKDVNIRRGATFAIGEIVFDGVDITPLIPALEAALNDSDKSVRTNVSYALAGYYMNIEELGNIDESLKQKVEQLLKQKVEELLKYKDANIKHGALFTLEKAVKNNVDITAFIPALWTALGDKDKDVKWLSAEILTAYYVNESEFDKIGELSRHKDANVRKGATWALGEAVRNDLDISPALQFLENALTDKDKWVKSNASYALATYYINDDDFEKVEELLKYDDNEIKKGVGWALSEAVRNGMDIGEVAPALLGVMFQLITDKKK